MTAFLTFCAAAIAGDGHATTWKLRDAARVGGLVTEVVGTPKFSRADAAILFDGQGDGIFVPANPIADLKAFTIQVRFRPDGSGDEEQRFLHIEDELKHRLLMETRVRERQWSLDTFLFQDDGHKLTLLDRSKLHPTDRWYWVALVYDGARMSSYIDGKLELTGEVEFAPMTKGRTSIGVRQNLRSWFKGAIAELRFSPVALPATKLVH